jgi:DNA-binding MarR family transcriptional regulator
MTQQYGLSQEQTTQLRAILQEEQQKASAILKDTSLTPPDVFAKMKSLKEEQITRISAIMTPEQRTKYESDIKKASAPPSQPSGFPPPPPGFPGGAPPTS